MSCVNREQLKKDLLLYAVTDRSWLGEETLYEQVEKALKGGATFIQLREKELDEEHFLEEAIALKELCHKYHVPFVINDNVKIAKEMDADGVHVGQSDMEADDVRKILGEDKILGVSAQTVEQAVLAEKMGADYLGVGAVFSTSTKKDASAISKERVKAICEAVHIPVIAIGGITADNILTLKGSGICGIAVVSAIFAAKDIEDATGVLLEKTTAMVNDKERHQSVIKGAIFDIDGTLLDSMPVWENAGARYLATLGIKARSDLKERLDALSLPEGALYMQTEYKLSVTIEEILEGVNQVVKDFYFKEAVLKPGVCDLIQKLKKNQVRLIIATATDAEMAKSALIRNGIWKDFDGMITCEEAGAGKTSPKVFELAREHLQTKKEETWVFEDSLYAVKTASKAGFPVCSIYDAYSRDNTEEIRTFSDIYVKDFYEIESCQVFQRKKSSYTDCQKEDKEVQNENSSYNCRK